MKKILFFTLIFFTLSKALGHSCDDDGFWKISSQYGTKKLSINCGNYNCHGFSAAYWEGGISLSQTPSWNQSSPISVQVSSPFSLGLIAQNHFSTSDKYIQVCNQSLGYVDVIYQDYGPEGGFHFLVRDISTSPFSPKFISKYGEESPVIGREYSSTWYTLNNSNKVQADIFYVYVGKLISSSTLAKDQTKTFHLNLKPGVSYNWSIDGTPGVVSITSSTNSSSVTIRADAPGTVNLKVSVSGCSGVPSKTQAISITVPNIIISGHYSTSLSSSNVLGNGNSVPPGNISTNLNWNGANNFVWEKYQGNVSFWAHTNQMHFNMQSGSYVSFRIYARNLANDTLAVRNVSYYNHGSFLLYPNPSTTSVNIQTDYNGKMDLEIISLNTSDIRKNITQIVSDQKVDITDLPIGEYLVIVTVEGKKVFESRLLKNE